MIRWSILLNDVCWSTPATYESYESNSEYEYLENCLKTNRVSNWKGCIVLHGDETLLGHLSQLNVIQKANQATSRNIIEKYLNWNSFSLNFRVFIL